MPVKKEFNKKGTEFIHRNKDKDLSIDPELLLRVEELFEKAKFYKLLKLGELKNHIWVSRISSWRYFYIENQNKCYYLTCFNNKNNTHTVGDYQDVLNRLPGWYLEKLKEWFSGSVVTPSDRSVSKKNIYEQQFDVLSAVEEIKDGKLHRFEQVKRSTELLNQVFMQVYMCDDAYTADKISSVIELWVECLTMNLESCTFFSGDTHERSLQLEGLYLNTISKTVVVTERPYEWRAVWNNNMKSRFNWGSELKSDTSEPLLYLQIITHQLNDSWAQMDTRWLGLIDEGNKHLLNWLNSKLKKVEDANVLGRIIESAYSQHRIDLLVEDVFFTFIGNVDQAHQTHVNLIIQLFDLQSVTKQKMIAAILINPRLELKISTIFEVTKEYEVDWYREAIHCLPSDHSFREYANDFLKEHSKDPDMKKIYLGKLVQTKYKVTKFKRDQWRNEALKQLTSPSLLATKEPVIPKSGEKRTKRTKRRKKRRGNQGAQKVLSKIIKDQETNLDPSPYNKEQIMALLKMEDSLPSHQEFSQYFCFENKRLGVRFIDETRSVILYLLKSRCIWTLSLIMQLQIYCAKEEKSCNFLDEMTAAEMVYRFQLLGLIGSPMQYKFLVRKMMEKIDNNGFPIALLIIEMVTLAMEHNRIDIFEAIIAEIPDVNNDAFYDEYAYYSINEEKNVTKRFSFGLGYFLKRDFNKEKLSCLEFLLKNDWKPVIHRSRLFILEGRLAIESNSLLMPLVLSREKFSDTDIKVICRIMKYRPSPPFYLIEYDPNQMVVSKIEIPLDLVLPFLLSFPQKFSGVSLFIKDKVIRKMLRYLWDMNMPYHNNTFNKNEINKLIETFRLYNILFSAQNYLSILRYHVLLRSCQSEAIIPESEAYQIPLVRTPTLPTTWLIYAAWANLPGLVDHLVSLGVDINQKASLDVNVFEHPEINLAYIEDKSRFLKRIDGIDKRMGHRHFELLLSFWIRGKKKTIGGKPAIFKNVTAIDVAILCRHDDVISILHRGGAVPSADVLIQMQTEPPERFCEWWRIWNNDRRESPNRCSCNLF